jgi:hypothetical protein
VFKPVGANVEDAYSMSTPDFKIKLLKVNVSPDLIEKLSPSLIWRIVEE